MMKQQNIANVILYDISKRRTSAEAIINTGLISEVVEGWNQNIYIIPPQSLRLHKPPTAKYILM